MKLKSLAFLLLLCASVQAAVYRTDNFVVTTSTPELAKEIGDRAEACRREMAELWLGEQLPNWSRPCPISARVGPQLGPGGQTSFTFSGSEVYGWNMSIQGSRERILDSVLPHEVTHTIFASYFREPLPRWADEGGCSSVEGQSEVAKYERQVVVYLKSRRGIAFESMLATMGYPPDTEAFYAQAHSVASWLIEKHGNRHFVHSLAAGLKDGNWPVAFGYSDAMAMQNDWMAWVRAGRPVLHTTAYQPCPQCQILIRSPIVRVRPVYPANVTVRPAQPTYPQPTADLQPPRQQPVTVTPVPGSEIDPGPPVERPQPEIDESAWEEWEHKQDEKLAAFKAEISVLIQQNQCQCDTQATADAFAAIQVAINNFNARIQAIEEKPAPTLAPFYIRVQDPRGEAYSTSYQKVELGSKPQYITLPFQPLAGVK